jgi:hypothetical protein
MELVDDDVAEVLEQLEPLRVVRKDRGVEHVGVGDHHLARGPHHGSHVRGCVAVVRVRLEADVRRVRECPQLHELVGGEGLGGEEVEGAGRLVARDGREDGQVVAERLARCRRRNDDDVSPGRDRRVRGCLVRVERLDAATAQRADEARVQPVGPRRVTGRPGLDLAVSDDQPLERRIAQQRADGIVDVGRSGGQHRFLRWRF